MSHIICSNPLLALCPRLNPQMGSNVPLPHDRIVFFIIFLSFSSSEKASISLICRAKVQTIAFPVQQETSDSFCSVRSVAFSDWFLNKRIHRACWHQTVVSTCELIWAKPEVHHVSCCVLCGVDSTGLLADSSFVSVRFSCSFKKQSATVAFLP